jgi:uncharacterized membrane protein
MQAMDWLAAAKVLLLSAAPIAELRGGLPLALALGFSPASAYVLAVAGNLLPVPLLLLVLGRLLPHLPRLPGPIGRGAVRYLAWQERRQRERFRHLGHLALVLFVATPLPATGAWTGAVIATLLGIPPWRALPLIALGVLIAGAAVLLAAVGLIALV